MIPILTLLIGLLYEAFFRKVKGMTEGDIQNKKRERVKDDEAQVSSEGDSQTSGCEECRRDRTRRTEGTEKPGNLGNSDGASSL